MDSNHLEDEMKVRFAVTKVTDLKHGPNWVLCNVKGQDDNGTRYSVVRWGKAAEQAAQAFPIDSTVELNITKGELVENKWSWNGNDYSELQLSRGGQCRLVRVSDATPAVATDMTEVVERLDKVEVRLGRIENALIQASKDRDNVFADSRKERKALYENTRDILTNQSTLGGMVENVAAAHGFSAPPPAVEPEPEPEPPKAKAPAKKRRTRKPKAAAKKTTKANDEIEAVDASAIPF
jgi:hypothetical protein